MGDFFGFAKELLEKGRAQVADPYAHAELYDLLNPGRADDEFYARFAQEQGGRVLDLACGSGRLLPLPVGCWSGSGRFGSFPCHVGACPAPLGRKGPRGGTSAGRYAHVYL